MSKILYIITQSEGGGAQRYVFDLAANLNHDQNYQTCVAAGGTGPLFNRLQAQNISTTKLFHLVRPISLWNDILAYFEIKKLLKQIKPDILHLNSSKAGFLGALAARTTGIKKVVYTAHGFVFNEPLAPGKKWLYKKIEFLSSRLIDKIICVSEFDHRSGLAAGIDPNKLVTVHNGIDSNNKFLSREAARQFFAGSLPALPNTKLIGCVANFYPSKGLDVLIKAMTGVKAILVLIGAGPEETNLRRAADNLRLQDKILFAGSIPEAAQYLKAFDLFVLPSHKEGLPYALLEAAAAGIPLVATNSGGIPEIIHNNKNGYLAPPDNVEILTQTINKALAYPLLPTLSGFDLTMMLNKTRAVYKN